MTEQEILSTMTRVLRDLLMNESIDLGMGTRRSDVPGWDSFMYVNFIVAVEQELKVKFNIADVEAFETVGDIVAAVRTLRS